MTPGAGRILQQKTGKQAAIVNRVAEAHQQHGNVLTAVMHLPAWTPLPLRSNRIVRNQLGLTAADQCGGSQQAPAYQSC